MQTHTYELTLRDLHTNRLLVFKQAANGEVHVYFDALSREASLDSGELLLAAQMLAAERGFDETAVRVELNNWLNGIISQSELIQRLRVHLAAIAVPVPVERGSELRDEKPCAPSTLNTSSSQRFEPLSTQAPFNSPNGAASTPMHQVIKEIVLERARQMELLANGDISCDCSDPSVHPDRKLRAATEELGEVARGIDLLVSAAAEDQRRGEPMPTPNVIVLRERLRTECIQLAAVSTAFAESLTEDAEALKREA